MPIFHGHTEPEHETNARWGRTRRGWRAGASETEMLSRGQCPRCLGALITETKMGRHGDDYEECQYCPECGKTY